MCVSAPGAAASDGTPLASPFIRQQPASDLHAAAAEPRRRFSERLSHSDTEYQSQERTGAADSRARPASAVVGHLQAAAAGAVTSRNDVTVTSSAAGVTDVTAVRQTSSLYAEPRDVNMRRARAEIDATRQRTSICSPVHRPVANPNNLPPPL